MRKLTAFVFAAILAVLAGPAFAADLPEYPPYTPPELPPVDHGLEGSFYLRGSVGANIMAAHDAVDYDPCACPDDYDFAELGYGYSLGAGFGYETGTGFRADVTVDYLKNRGMTADSGHSVELRSGLVLANAYYDVMLDRHGSVGGGFGVYGGLGLGFAYNTSRVFDDTGTQVNSGQTVEAAGAVMAGVSYDMGNMVADLGYRGIYMPKVMSTPTLASGDYPYVISDNLIHEVRGTVRYRFN